MIDTWDLFGKALNILDCPIALDLSVFFNNCLKFNFITGNQLFQVLFGEAFLITLWGALLPWLLLLLGFSLK